MKTIQDKQILVAADFAGLELKDGYEDWEGFYEYHKLGSVSYTHLDVYKRQVQRFPWKSRFSFPPILIHSFKGAAPQTLSLIHI